MLLQINKLSLSLGGNVIFDQLTTPLPINDCLFLVGPNGAGKTVLLNVLDNLIKPSHGSFYFTPRVKKASFLFQRPVFLQRTVWQNMLFPLQGRFHFLGYGITSEQQALATDLLARHNLLHKKKQLATSLSGGEQQKLAMARALMTKPQLLLMDEPTAHLDHKGIHSFEDLTRQAIKAGSKVIFVSHDLAQAKRLASHIALMHKGKVVACQKNKDFFTKPKNDLQKSFLEGKLLP